MGNLQRASGVDDAGATPLHLCPNCAAYIIAATWSERVSERCVRNVWSCESCGFEFETSAYFQRAHPAEAD
jgi:ribosomal protein L37AE/L43A